MYRLFLLCGVLGMTSIVHASVRSAHLTAQAVGEAAQGHRAHSLELLREAVSSDPSDGEAHHHLGRILLAEGKYDDALNELQIGESLGYPAGEWLGATWLQMGRYAEAVSALTLFIEREPRNIPAHFLLGQSYLRLRRPAMALTPLQRAAEDETWRPRAELYRGLALLALGSEDEARDAFETAAQSSDRGVAAEARHLLAMRKRSGWSLQASLSHQVDTNVILAQRNTQASAGLFTPEEISNRVGNRWVLSLQTAYDTPATAGWSFGGGYAAYQSYHRTHRATLQHFDVSNHTVFVRAKKEMSRWTLSLPVYAGSALLGPLVNSVADAGVEPMPHVYNRSLTLAPLFLYGLGAHVVGAGYTGTAERFTASPGSITVPGKGRLSQDRSNITHGFDVHSYTIWARTGRFETSLGFFTSDAKEENVWDHSGIRASLLLASPDVSGLRLAGNVELASRNYRHVYPVPGDNGFQFRARSDRAWSGSARLEWQSGSWRALMGSYWQRNVSSVELFDWSRAIYTVGMGVEL